MSDFVIGVFVAAAALTGIVVAAYFVARRVFERAANRVADEIGRVVAEATGRGPVRPVGRNPTARGGDFQPGRVTNLGAYAAREGISEDAARREFADSIERTARLMDGAVRLPVIGPVGLDALIGLFPVAGDAISGAIALSLVGRSIKYGVPKEIITRMLTNVLIDVALGAMPVVGDIADMWFRANLRNVELLREYLGDEARNTFDATPTRVE